MTSPDVEAPGVATFHIPRQRSLGMVEVVLLRFDGDHPDEVFANFNYLNGRATIRNNPMCKHDPSHADARRMRLFHIGAFGLRLDVASAGPATIAGTFKLRCSDAEEISFDGPTEGLTIVEVTHITRLGEETVFSNRFRPIEANAARSLPG